MLKNWKQLRALVCKEPFDFIVPKPLYLEKLQNPHGTSGDLKILVRSLVFSGNILL
jgi:hypothetical protein